MTNHGLLARPPEYDGEGDPPGWGVSHTIAAALVALDLNVVHRSTLRSLLPSGRIKPKKVPPARGGSGTSANVRRVNGLDAYSRRLIELGQVSDPNTLATTSKKTENAMSKTFQKALQRLEVNGWIARGTRFVLVRDMRSLMDWTTAAEPPPGWGLDFARSIEQIKGDLADPGDSTARELEQRRQELLAIQRLMEQGFGSRNWSGRGSVRFIPRGKTI